VNVVAVLGGGPAGASAAKELAAAGVRAIVFDEKMAWEKPCGGGVTFKAYREYPFLLEAGRHRQVDRTELRTEGAGGVSLRLQKPMLIFARQELNQLLLDRAAEAGAELRKARVTGLRRAGGRWEIRAGGETVHADFVVAATGARNPLRQVGTEFTGEDSMTGLGYYIPHAGAGIDLQFFPDFEGYIWVFPRQDHSSAGICGKGEPAAAMRQRLERYLDERGLAWKGSPFYGHMLPALATTSWAANRLAGEGWLAAGDAAGLVDPITGEGIYFAMRSGELAGRLIATGRPEEYAAAVQREFAGDLAYASTLARRLFRGHYFFGANTARLVQFLRRSRQLNGVAQDLFAGTLGYHELRRRINGNLHKTLTEIAVNLFLGRTVSEGME